LTLVMTTTDSRELVIGIVITMTAVGPGAGHLLIGPIAVTGNITGQIG
jgi:hypothetical protein